jgi:hypothetical protein
MDDKNMVESRCRYETRTWTAINTILAKLEKAIAQCSGVKSLKRLSALCTEWETK